MSFIIGDRVTLQTDINVGNQVKAGTVCTVCSVIPNGKKEMLALRSGYDKESGRPIIFGAPIDMVRKATEDEIKGTDYRELISENFYAGKVYSLGDQVSFDEYKKGDKASIVKVSPKENESYDLITFKFDNTDKTFEKNFVETYFFLYDSEVEKMLGEEIDLKKAKKNFFLPGARMLTNQEYPNNVVIIIGKNEDTLLAENLEGKTIDIDKAELKPINNIESLYSEIGPQNLIQINYRAGEKLIALPEIEQHMLLSESFKPGDVISILGFESINVNAFEDQFLIETHKSEYKILHWLDLKKFFKRFEEDQIIDKEDEKNVDPVSEQSKIIGFHEEQQVKEDVNNVLDDFKSTSSEKEEKTEKIEVVINDVSILGYNFRIDTNDRGIFYLDSSNKSYRVEDINNIVKALEAFKKFMSS